MTPIVVSDKKFFSNSPSLAPFSFSPANTTYFSSLRSLGNSQQIRCSELIAQFLEAIVMLAMVPFFIYAFFLTTLSLIFLPFMLILFPLIFVSEVMREILYVIFPGSFPDF